MIHAAIAVLPPPVIADLLQAYAQRWPHDQVQAYLERTHQISASLKSIAFWMSPIEARATRRDNPRINVAPGTHHTPGGFRIGVASCATRP